MECKGTGVSLITEGQNSLWTGKSLCLADTQCLLEFWFKTCDLEYDL